MNNNQIKLLNKLAKKLETNHQTKEATQKSLQEAKIINPKGQFTKHYPNLKKLTLTNLTILILCSILALQSCKKTEPITAYGTTLETLAIN